MSYIPITVTDNLVEEPTPTMEATEMARIAADFVNSTSEHVFLTGKAGTGKTTFLRQLADSTHKSHIILAPTGIAALNAKGVTLHSQFMFPFGSFVPERRMPQEVALSGPFFDESTLAAKRPINMVRKKVLRQCDLLIIDEVSMLRADLLDAVDYRMRAAKGNYKKSFGGAQVLLIGDLFQLPPIVKDHEWKVLSNYYASPHFFEARCLKNDGFVHLELDKIFRQQDGGFIRILNNLRNNCLTHQDLEVLNARFDPKAAKITEGVVTLCTHNRQADEINQRELADLFGKSHKFHAEIDGDFPEGMYPVAEELELKEGAQIMFIKNDREQRYFNGKLATIKSIDGEEIIAELADDEGIVEIQRELWENKKYEVNGETKEIDENVVGAFSHFPIKLAWAITVHKSQGLTFDKAIIDVGSAFAPGQVYVALSRLRSLDGLILRTPVDPSVVSNDAQVVEFTRKKEAVEMLPAILRERQQSCLVEMIQHTFDLSELAQQAMFLQNKHNTKQEFADVIMREALPGIATAFQNERNNTTIFRQQLETLLRNEDLDKLLERLRKGAAYYIEFLFAQLKVLLQHIEEVDQFAKTKTYSGALGEFEGMIMKRIGQMQRGAYMVERVLNSDPIERTPELALERSERYGKLKQEVRAYVSEHRVMNKGKTGRKRKKKSDDGSPKPAKGETYRISYALHKEGKSIEEIAKERDLKPSTIESHMVKGIAAGEVDINKVMNADDIEALRKVFEKNIGASLGEIQGKLKGAYSYGQLGMVRAMLEKES